jgi:hypothetical protein
MAGRVCGRIESLRALRTVVNSCRTNELQGEKRAGRGSCWRVLGHLEDFHRAMKRLCRCGHYARSVELLKMELNSRK